MAMSKRKLKKQLNKLKDRLQDINDKKEKLEVEIGLIETQLDPCGPMEDIGCCTSARDSDDPYITNGPDPEFYGEILY